MDKQKKERNKSILDFSPSEAKNFFLKEKSYCTERLPPYITFNKLLADIDRELTGKELKDVQQSSPQNYDNLNHVIFTNKDGQYAWRPITLIHPALYVSLVHKITEEKNWKDIRQRFKEFSEDKRINCISYPVESRTEETDKAELITHWWEKLEQRSIELALEYEYLFKTDITDCYSSIYTHSIAWALHTKEGAKNHKRNKKLIGNIIDDHIGWMSHGQTNGIPQGSVLMDFIAEIVLGYADSELTKKIKKIKDYHILRYRDDYHIFVNNPQDGQKILKALTETMIELGLTLSAAKTISTDQIIQKSIKPDKLYWIRQKQTEKSLQKHLFIIHTLAKEFPNSGSLVRTLNDYLKRIAKKAKHQKIKQDSLLPLISIVIYIFCKNPKTYPYTTAILSQLIFLIDNEDTQQDIIDKIKKRLDKIPHTGQMEIWLQRFAYFFNIKSLYVNF